MQCRGHLLGRVIALGAPVFLGLSLEPLRAQHAGQGAQKAIFDTHAEAEAAAKQFNCTRAHKMGEKWMPCRTHGEATGGKAKTAGH